MISWMQKHRKYMVWTIWVATVGFIGAGSVGWGSLHFGSKSTSIAKVGDIEISQQKLNQAYNDLYTKYSQIFKGNFDEKKAKELGLVQQAFATVEVQAKLLNFAKENGIIVTDKEVANKITSIQAFYKDGVFDKNIYKTFLKNRHMKAKEFEETLKDEMTIQKTLSLLDIPAQPLEIESVGSALNVADKIAYKILTEDDINITIDEAKLKEFWKQHKEDYQTNTLYELAIIWKEPKEINTTEGDLKSYYQANSFQFTDSNGKLLTFEEAKEAIKNTLALKATKKSAQLDYIALKKGKISQPTPIKLVQNDSNLTKEAWEEIKEKKSGDILKPKIIGNKYAIIKIVSIIPPRVKTFEEAKDEISSIYETQQKKALLEEKAQNMVKKLQNFNPLVTDFVKLNDFDKIKTLNKEEGLHFLQNILTSSTKSGIIVLSNRVVVYNVIEQKIDPIDTNMTKELTPFVHNLKSELYQSNLIRTLHTQYKTEVYMKGLKQ